MEGGGGGRWGGGGAKFSDFFTKDPNLNFFGGVRGPGARVSDFFYKESKSKKKRKKCVWAGVGRGWGRGRWTDIRTGPIPFAPSTSSKWGGITMNNVQVMALTGSNYDQFII